MEIKSGDLFENTEGAFCNGKKCTILVCSWDCTTIRYPDKKFPWNCLELWWYKGGMRGHTGDLDKGFSILYDHQLAQLKKIGNIYDAINQQFGELVGTSKTEETSKALMLLSSEKVK